VELAVDVATDGNWAPDWLHIDLSGKDFFGLFAKSLDLILCDWLVGIELLNVPLESLDLAHV